MMKSVRNPLSGDLPAHQQFNRGEEFQSKACGGATVTGNRRYNGRAVD